MEETARARGMLVASREASRCTRRASACYRYSVLVARARERMASSAIILLATGSKPEMSVASQILASNQILVTGTRLPLAGEIASLR